MLYPFLRIGFCTKQYNPSFSSERAWGSVQLLGHNPFPPSLNSSFESPGFPGDATHPGAVPQNEDVRRAGSIHTLKEETGRGLRECPKHLQGYSDVIHTVCANLVVPLSNTHIGFWWKKAHQVVKRSVQSSKEQLSMSILLDRVRTAQQGAVCAVKFLTP